MAYVKFTIFGGQGFIGRYLVDYLRERYEDVGVASRGDDKLTNLGHVIFAIGLTGNFRTRPFDTVEAHVSVLSQTLRQGEFDSWMYLSNTRVYSGLGGNAIGE